MTDKLSEIEEYLEGFNLELPISLDLSNIDLRYEEFNLLYDKYLKNFSTIIDLDLSHNTHLNLNYHRIYDPNSEELLLNIIKNNPSLSSLNLSHVELHNLDKILNILQNRTTLTKLKVKECFNYDEELNLLINVLQNNTLLTDLSLNYDYKNNNYKIFKKLCQTIKNHASLNKLNLLLYSSSNIINSLYELLKDNFTLKIKLTLILSLEEYEYTEDLKLIYQMLKNNTSIINLHLILDYISSNNFLYFDNILSLNSYSINKLCIEHSKDNISEVIKILCNTLKFNNTLTDLQLIGNMIEDDDIKPLCDLLQVNTTLTTLNLSNNEITGYGLKLLSDVLKVNTTLIELNLLRNRIGDEDNGLISLADLLKINTTLTKLQLSSYQYDSIEYFNTILLLCESLKFNNTLTELNISKYQYDALSYNTLILYNKKLSEVLEYNTTLTELHFN